MSASSADYTFDLNDERRKQFIPNLGSSHGQQQVKYREEGPSYLDSMDEIPLERQDDYINSFGSFPTSEHLQYDSPVYMSSPMEQLAPLESYR